MGYIRRTESPRDLKFCIFINFFRKKLSPTSESRAVVIDAIKRAVAMRKKEEVSDLVLFFFTLRWRQPTDEEKNERKTTFFLGKKMYDEDFPLLRFELCEKKEVLFF